MGLNSVGEEPFMALLVLSTDGGGRRKSRPEPAKISLSINERPNRIRSRTPGASAMTLLGRATGGRLDYRGFQRRAAPADGSVVGQFHCSRKNSEIKAMAEVTRAIRGITTT